MTTARPRDLGEYLEARIEKDPDDGCWLWTLACDRDGYGVATWGGKTHRAHRLAYQHWVGPIPGGDELDHTCETRACVRPTHLDPVPGLVNLERKHLRQGETPARARELALLDQEMYAREHEKRRAAALLARQHRTAIEEADAVGVKVGTRLRRSTSKTAVTWRVTKVTGFTEGPWVTIVAQGSGYQDQIPLAEAAAATLIT